MYARNQVSICLKKGRLKAIRFFRRPSTIQAGRFYLSCLALRSCSQCSR
ncbi:hypothetical protein [Neisseria sicca]|nr:hypothetical protein [Neisseria sicca]